LKELAKERLVRYSISPVLHKDSVHDAGPLIFEGSLLPKVWNRMFGDFNRALTTLLVEAAV
jgi:hypothetical protein